MNEQLRDAVRLKLTAFLSRRARPKDWTDADATKALDALVDRAMAHLPSTDTGPAITRFKAALQRLEEGERSNRWPTPDALQAALAGARGDGEQAAADALAAAKLNAARAWWTRFRDLGPWRDERAVIRALVAEGVSAAELWRAGAAVPSDLLKEDAGRGAIG